MEKILNFEDFQTKLKTDAAVKATFEAAAALEAVENTELEKHLEEISETELPELYKEYEVELVSEADEFKVTEPIITGDSIILRINGQKYKFVSKPEIDIKEVFRKFEKMMGFAKAGGKALAWLHKQLGKGEKIA